MPAGLSRYYFTLSPCTIVTRRAPVYLYSWDFLDYLHCGLHLLLRRYNPLYNLPCIHLIWGLRDHMLILRLSPRSPLRSERDFEYRYTRLIFRSNTYPLARHCNPACGILYINTICMQDDGDG